ncbi:MAG: hypothetical protein NVSMB18_07320 [Acetobacteraceae bacterium]
MWRERAFAAATAGEGVRALGKSAVERLLLARLEVTGQQRGARHLCSIEASPPDGSVALWFPNRALGLGTGVGEGVALPRNAGCALEQIEHIGSNLDERLLHVAAPVDDESEPLGSRRTFQLRRWIATRVISPLKEQLPLADDFEAMLARLGRHTRRNIRAARREAVDHRIGFSVTTGPCPLSAPVLASLAVHTQPHRLAQHRVRRLENHADRTGRAFRSVLTAADGTVISYCCGFLDGSSAYLLYQLNNPEWNWIGPSLLHRSYLIEALIGRGCSELTFLHGCSGTLRHSCIPMKFARIVLMRRTATAFVSAAAIAALKPKTGLGIGARAVLAGGLEWTGPELSRILCHRLGTVPYLVGWTSSVLGQTGPDLAEIASAWS